MECRKNVFENCRDFDEVYNLLESFSGKYCNENFFLETKKDENYIIVNISKNIGNSSSKWFVNKLNKIKGKIINENNKFVFIYLQPDVRLYIILSVLADILIGSMFIYVGIEKNMIEIMVAFLLWGVIMSKVFIYSFLIRPLIRINDFIDKEMK